MSEPDSFEIENLRVEYLLVLYYGPAIHTSATSLANSTSASREAASTAAVLGHFTHDSSPSPAASSPPKILPLLPLGRFRVRRLVEVGAAAGAGACAGETGATFWADESGDDESVEEGVGAGVVVVVVVSLVGSTPKMLPTGRLRVRRLAEAPLVSASVVRAVGAGIDGCAASSAVVASAASTAVVGGGSTVVGGGGGGGARGGGRGLDGSLMVMVGLVGVLPLSLR